MCLESCIYKAELWFEGQVSLLAPKAFFIVVSNFILLIQVDSEYIYGIIFISILSERTLRTPCLGDTRFTTV